jgi:hypothetical protein
MRADSACGRLAACGGGAQQPPFASPGSVVVENCIRKRPWSLRSFAHIDVIDVLCDLFILRGIPAHIRSDNGPEFVAKAVQEWIAAVGFQDRLHRAGPPLGERLHRELQRPPSR